MKLRALLNSDPDSFYRGVVEPTLMLVAGGMVSIGIIALDPQGAGILCFCAGIFTGYGIVWSMSR